MLFSHFDQYSNDFDSVPAEELIEIAKRVAAELQLPPPVADVNERLLRHYVSAGVVTRPDRVGREVRYGSRHLLELLVTRFLVTKGFPLNGLPAYTVDRNKKELAEDLQSYAKSGQPATAADLVTMFRASTSRKASKLAEMLQTYNGPAGAHPRRPLPKSDTSLGVVDVLQELRTIDERMQHHLVELDQRFREALMTNDQTKALLAQVEGLQRLLIENAHRQKEFVRDMFRDLHDAQQAQMQQMLTRLFDEHTAKILAAVRTTRLNDTNDKPDINPAP